MRVEIAVNDGTKKGRKPFVIRSADFAQFTKAALASLNIKGNAPVCYDESGRAVLKISDIVPGSLLLLSGKGEAFLAPLNKQKKKQAPSAPAADTSTASTASTSGAAAPTDEKAWKFCFRGMHKLSLGISPIVPDFLYVGSARDAHSADQMHEHRISQILNVAREVPQSPVAVQRYAAAFLDDNDEQLLDAALPSAFRFLDAARGAQARVLVHCVVGKSRSVAVVLAYMIARCDMSLLDAWRAVRKARPLAQPNANFLRQLMSLEQAVRGACTLTWALVHADVLPPGAPADVIGWLRTYGEAAPVGSERAALATHAWVTPLTVERFVVARVRVAELLSLAALAEPMLLHEIAAAADDGALRSLGAGKSTFEALLAASTYAPELPRAPAIVAQQSSSIACSRGVAGELAVVAYLRRFGVERAVDEFALKSRAHETHRNLVALSYTEAASDFASPVVRQCRGIVVDTKEQFRPVCLPFDKFFNLGDARADELDWSSVVLTEKLDGSFAKLYHYKNAWHVASQSLPDGNGSVGNVCTFAELFWRIFRACGYALPDAAAGALPSELDAHELTFMFEMMTPVLPIVIVPTEEKLWLIGVRDRRTGAEFDPVDVAGRLGWAHAPVFVSVASADDALAAVRRLNAREHEGFVARDAQFRRVKIKSPGYVASALLRGKQASGADPNNLSTKAALSVVRIGEASEFLLAFPEHRPLFDFVQKRFNVLKKTLLQHLQENEEQDEEDEEDGDEEEDEEEDDDDGLVWQPQIGPVRKLLDQFDGERSVAGVAQFLIDCDTDLLLKAIGKRNEGMAMDRSWSKMAARKQRQQKRRGGK